MMIKTFTGKVKSILEKAWTKVTEDFRGKKKHTLRVNNYK